MAMNGNGNYRLNLFLMILFVIILSIFRFCPSVFFYLCTVVPSVWFLELDIAERRSKFNVTQVFGLPPGTIPFDIDDTLPVKIIFISFFSSIV
jgi:hypothetical protein